MHTNIIPQNSLTISGVTYPVFPGRILPHWRSVARGKGFDLTARIIDRLHLAARCHRCGGEALRGLVDRIVLQPRPEGGKLDIHLEGALAALLMLSLGSKHGNGSSGKAQAIEFVDKSVLVAGAGFEPAAFRL